MRIVSAPADGDSKAVAWHPLKQDLVILPNDAFSTLQRIKKGMSRIRMNRAAAVEIVAMISSSSNVSQLTFTFSL